MMNAAAPAPRGSSGSLSVPVLPTNPSVSRHFRPGRHRVASPQDSFHLHAFGDHVHQRDAQSTRTDNTRHSPAPSNPATPNDRPGRSIVRRPLDEFPNQSYGDSPFVKDPASTRLFYQNVKGLTYSSSGEDYKYYLSSLNTLQVDVSGLAETNSAWAHTHLQTDFRQCVKRQFGQGKINFGHPSVEIDQPHIKETFQAGGSLTMVVGSLVPYAHGSLIMDPTGLGRWSGVSIRGTESRFLSIITAYRPCNGTIRTAPIGSTFNREYEYHKSNGINGPRPRQIFLRDLKVQIHSLQALHHAIVLMLDANATLATDPQFAEMASECDLNDLHALSPAPSTYMGASNRRIDYILGCSNILRATTKQGTLSYYEGPQADHRGLFVDIDFANLLGIQSSPSIVTPSSRLLKSGNPESVASYNEAMIQYSFDHRMTDRIQQLDRNKHMYTRSRVRKLLEAWDDDQGRAMRHAESSLRRPPQPYQWSAELRNAGILRRYWRLRLRECLHNETHDAIFERLECQITAADSTFKLPFRSVQLPEIRSHLNLATKALTKVQTNATEVRYRSYYDLAAAYASDTHPDTMKESAR